MILFIDIGTDLAPAVSLAYEAPEDELMLIVKNKNFYYLIN